LHDTLNSNTLPAGDPDDSLDNMDDDYLLESEGKAQLGGSLETGITTILQNAQLAFEGNYTPAELGTATSADSNGTTLTDTSAQFETNGVTRGAVLLNWDDRSATEVLRVVDENTVEHRPLKGGNNNDWEIGDAYSVYNVIQKLVSDGNLVAVDGVGDPLDAIFPTFCTQVVVALDTSAAAIPTAGLTPSQQEIRDALTLDKSGGAPAAGSVDEKLDSNPANVVTALGDTEYDGVKYSDILQDLLAMASGDITEDPVGTFTVYERDGLTPRYIFKKVDNKRLRQ
jgi:hypothetical protein